MKTDWIIKCCNETLLDKVCDSSILDELTAKELQKLLSFASKHGMLPVVMESLNNKRTNEQAKISIIIYWYGLSEASKKEYLFRLSLMEEMTMQFKNDGLDVMFLKGATTARLYPRPELRVFGDIDYYMFGESDKSIEVLKKMGIETKEYFNHHTQASLNGVLLENHYDFLDRDNHKGNLMMDDELKRLAKEEGHNYRFEFANAEIDNAYCMSPTMNAIFLMRHMAAHFFSESVALRMLYDWALFLKKYAKEVDWKLVLPLYEKAGMPKFSRMIQGILISKLGWDFSDCPIEPINDAMTERIWKSIIESPESNPYRMNSIRYLIYEAKVFYANRWKHGLVFKDESYWYLFYSYTWQHLKKKIGLN